MRRVSLRLDEETIARLTRNARRKGVNFGQFARRVLNVFNDQDPAPRCRTRVAATSTPKNAHHQPD